MEAEVLSHANKLNLFAYDYLKTLVTHKSQKWLDSKIKTITTNQKDKKINWKFCN